MSYLLNIVYLVILILASPWLLYSAIVKRKYREGFAEKLLGRAPRRESGRPCVWLHAVSVGEVNLLATLLAEIESRRPDVECVISTTTTTGYALATEKYAPRTVFYCPLDFSWAVKSALRRIRPDVLVLAELELWPNLIRLAKAHGAKVAVVNGRLSENSFRGYRRVAPLVRRVLAQIDVVAVQNEEYAQRFRALLFGRARLLPSQGECDDSAIGCDTHDQARQEPRPPNINVTGSLKFDGAQTDRANAKTRELAALAGIAETDVVFLAGSTQEPEEEVALAAFAALRDEFPNLRLILVPRHPDRFDDVAGLLDRSGLPWQRRSELTPTPVGRIANPSKCEVRGVTDGLAIRPTRILLVDTIGELGAWWGTAHVAFVGGSMGSRGGQNMIEPAAYGAAVSFGPKTKNFRDIVQLLLAADAAVVVEDGQAMQAFVRRCLLDPQFTQSLGQRAQELVRSGTGATQKTVDLLAPLLPPVVVIPAKPLRRAG